MRDRLHELAIARTVLLRVRARLTALLATFTVTLLPAVRTNAGAALVRLDADLARLAREEAALHAAGQDGG